jgi:choloylglycine hydrolase
VKSIVVVPTPAPALDSPQGIVPGAHFFVQDRSGKSIVIEPVDGTLKVHDAPLGVMTNAPTYHWHMTNLKNYHQSLGEGCRGALSSGRWRFSPLAPARACTGISPRPRACTACPAISPRPRASRAAIYSQSAPPNATVEDAVLSALHILNQFDIPKGAVQNSAIGGTVDEITEWTSVADLKNLRWYFRTFTDQSVHMVDLKQVVEAAKGELRILKMEGTSQPTTDASTNFVAGK